MRNNGKNIDLGDGNFPERLRSLREALHLSQSDLAEKAGLTYRTVHDLELGKRKVSQQKTLMLLAQALGVNLEALLGKPRVAPPRKSHRGTWLRISLALIVLIGVGGGLLWQTALSHAEWTLEKGQLTVSDGILGLELWKTDPDNPVLLCVDSPWDPNHLLIGTNRECADGGRAYCLARASGDTVWSVGPDLDAMFRALDRDDVLAAGFSCKLGRIADLDGDNDPEFVVGFLHGLYYPYAVCLIDKTGHLRSQYVNKGHVYDLLIADIDADGKDEIVAAGVNNSPGHNGPTLFVLDDIHNRGASLDDLCNPWSSEPDSALVRINLPSYPAPYMDLMQMSRIGAVGLQFNRGPDGEGRLICRIGNHEPEKRILIHLNADLRPVGAEPRDLFLEKVASQWPDSLRVGTGPGDQVWLAEWMAGLQRYEAGHWPH